MRQKYCSKVSVFPQMAVSIPSTYSWENSRVWLHYLHLEMVDKAKPSIRSSYMHSIC
jgi:hypothetical protein